MNSEIKTMSEQPIEETTEGTPTTSESAAEKLEALNNTNVEPTDAVDVEATEETTSEETEAKEEKKKAQSPALRTLARKEKKLQEKRKELEEREKSITERAQAVEDARIEFNTDPVSFAKKVMGVEELSKDDALDFASYFWAASGALDDQPDHYVWKRIKERKMETAQQRLERQQREWQESQKKTEEEKAQQAQIQQYKSTVINHLNSKLEELPYVNRIIEKKGSEFATEHLWAWIEDQLNAGENRVTDPAFVAENFNTYLQQEAQSIREMFEDLFNTASEEGGDTASENTAPTISDEQPMKSAANKKPRTLNNQITQQTNRSPQKLSTEEKLSRAARALQELNGRS